MEFPGLIDLQVNGYKGIDFSDSDLTCEKIREVADMLWEEGIDAFLPTLVSAPEDIYKHNLPLIAEVIEEDQYQNRILGIHIEGPFISPQDGARGAHSIDSIQAPDLELFARMVSWSRGHIKILTLAADLQNSDKLAIAACQKGVIVSLGHHLAGKEDLRRLSAAGATALTHLGNGIPHFAHRHDNSFFWGLDNESLMAMIITDGHHLPPSVIKIIMRVKSFEKIILTSDSSSLAGLPPGVYKWFGDDVEISPQGKLSNPTTGYLMGSALNLLQCANFLATLDLTAPKDILKMARDNPLKLLGLDPEIISQKLRLNFDSTSKVFEVKGSPVLHT